MYRMKAQGELWDAQSQNHKPRKSGRYFPFSMKNAYFSMEIIKNFGQKMGI